MGAKKWSKKDEDFLTKNWGIKTCSSIAKMLNRPTGGVVVKARRLGLGNSIEVSHLKKTQCAKILGVEVKTIDYWTNKHDFPLKQKKLNFRTVGVINISSLLNWLKNKQELYNASRIEFYGLGVEPQWLKDKRKQDSAKIWGRAWTKAEVDLLTIMYKQGVSYELLSKRLNRDLPSIKRKLYNTGLKKPNKLTKKSYLKWTSEEEKILLNMLLAGKSYKEIGTVLNRSVQGVKTKALKRLVGWREIG